jgi:hypothetical protein
MTFVDGELGGVPRLVLGLFHQKSIYGALYAARIVVLPAF